MTREVLEVLTALEQAASALVEIGDGGPSPEGVLTRYREAGGALGGIAEVFITARRAALRIIDEAI